MALPLAGGILTAAALYEGPSSYTPALGASTTDPTLGTGAIQAGSFYRLGDLIWFEFRIRFGTSGAAAGTGFYDVSLPTAVNGTFHNASTGISLHSIVGNGTARDDSALATSRKIALGLSTLSGGSGGVGEFRMYQMDGTNSTVRDDAPWIWTNSDAISGSGLYLQA